MGLDQYLKRGKKIPRISFNKYIEIHREIDTDKDLQLKYKDYIQECGTNFHWKALLKEVGYWRKANQIHRWFVENVQNNEDDCGYYKVTKVKLQKLLSLCKRVQKSCTLEAPNGDRVRKIINPVIAQKLLPTCDGFFFGSTDYNEYYLCDINDTIEILEDVLKTTDFKNEYIVYTSSW